MTKRAPKPHQPLNLLRPSKFSHDEEKFLNNIFNRFGEEIQVLLGSMLQTKILLKLSKTERLTYQTYCNSLGDPTCLVIFRIDPETRSLIFIDIPLSFALLDRLMGGKGRTIEKIRYFTEIEQAVLKKVLVKVLEAVSASFSDVVALSPQFDTMEFNPMGVHIASPSEEMVIATYQARIAHGIGAIQLCIPFKYLKSVIPKASFDQFLLTRDTEVSAPSADTVAPIFTKSLEAARVPVSVELGSVEIFFQDLLKIEEGDCIRLASSIEDPLRIKINNKTKFLGRPGIRDNKISVQVTKVLTEGDEEFEE